MDGIRDKAVTKSVHLHQRREPRRVAVVVGVDALGECRARGGLDGLELRVHPAGEFLAHEGEREPAEVGAAAGAADDDVRGDADGRKLLQHSSPMTVWCSRTWLSTLPRQYLVSPLVAATSTASEMAIPRLPGLLGSAARSFLPASVTSDGDGCTLAPHVSIISLLYGFWSYDARTCHTCAHMYTMTIFRNRIKCQC